MSSWSSLVGLFGRSSRCLLRCGIACLLQDDPSEEKVWSRPKGAHQGILDIHQWRNGRDRRTAGKRKNPQGRSVHFRTVIPLVRLRSRHTSFLRGYRLHVLS